MKTLLFLILNFSINAFGAAPATVVNYGGASWMGTCTNLTTGGSQSSQMSFEVSAYPVVKLGINGASFSLTVGTKSNITLPSKVIVGILLELSANGDFVFHTYNQAVLTAGSQEQQMRFTLADSSHLSMRQDSWNYVGGATEAGDSYFCKYSR